MKSSTDVFLSATTAFRHGYDEPADILRIEDAADPASYVVLFLGHVGHPDHAAQVVRQLRALAETIAPMLAAAERNAPPEPGPDDPTDEPTDEPATGPAPAFLDVSSRAARAPRLPDQAHVSYLDG